ncbi:replication initiation protein [Acinetobacter bereziniae]|uniref:replication initiation protein n=1 Tax=Acinetobacter bereziniae TaxID=106648 RepID=UPI0021D039A2|nr:replication initiation protein [Acinetobacter bereziniae]MCU4419582.1 replication initiation protein [Acinetobacter bereziniae]
MQLSLALDSFQETLPKKPYCTNDLSQGLLIRPKEMAIKFKYLQPDHPYYQNYLILDLDYESSLIEILYSMTGIPLPNLLVENKENGRSHIFFNLKTPVYKTNASKIKPIIYANAVLKRLQLLFNADVGYSGLIAKNPIHEQWRAYTLRDKPYSLNELASKLEIDWKEANKPIKQDEAIGLGRNCYVFHTARFWAYTAVREFRGKTYNQWLQTVIDHCLKLNEGITEPMQYGEIKGIAKSIARYCWKKDAYHYQEFIQRQAYKGTLGGIKSGEVRRKNSISEKKPWLELGVSRATYYRRLKGK